MLKTHRERQGKHCGTSQPSLCTSSKVHHAHMLPFRSTLHRDHAAALLETESCHHTEVHHLNGQRQSSFLKCMILQHLLSLFSNRERICSLFPQGKHYCQILAENWSNNYSLQKGDWDEYVQTKLLLLRQPSNSSYGKDKILTHLSKVHCGYLSLTQIYVAKQPVTAILLSECIHAFFCSSRSETQQRRLEFTF